MVSSSGIRAAVVLGCAALLGPALAFAQGRSDSGGSGGDGAPTLTVSSSADVRVQPDQAVVRLGVLAEAPDAAQAQERVNEIMQRVLDALEDLGVPERSVRTEDLSLFPVYSNPRPLPQREPEEPRITGYRASNVVSIVVVELARIGEIVDAGIEAGANQLQGIFFGARNDAGARAEAMRLAVEEARLQADAIAGAMGMRVAGVREVVAGGYGVRPPMPLQGGRAYAEADLMAAVQPGEVEISATVTVTYELAEQAD